MINSINNKNGNQAQISFCSLVLALFLISQPTLICSPCICCNGTSYVPCLLSLPNTIGNEANGPCSFQKGRRGNSCIPLTPGSSEITSSTRALLALKKPPVFGISLPIAVTARAALLEACSKCLQNVMLESIMTLKYLRYQPASVKTHPTCMFDGSFFSSYQI